jgi:hypothetical protein
MVKAFAMQQPKPFDAVRIAGTVHWAASAFRFEAGARSLVVVHVWTRPLCLSRNTDVFNLSRMRTRNR